VAEKRGLLEYDYTTVAFGHGYGLDIVEEPYLYWGNRQPLEVGMTFYVEPMIIDHQARARHGLPGGHGRGHRERLRADDQRDAEDLVARDGGRP